MRRQIATLRDPATSLVIIVAPFPLKEGSCCEDDGLRLQSSYTELQDLTRIYERVLALLQIPFYRLVAESPEGRLKEVLRLSSW